MMMRSHLVAGALLLATACGGSADTEPDSSTGGSAGQGAGGAGKAGSSGTSGHAGTSVSGTSGQGGAAGSPAGGAGTGGAGSGAAGDGGAGSGGSTAGDGGTAGAGGTAGDGGDAGQGGTAGAGAGGSGAGTAGAGGGAGGAAGLDTTTPPAVALTTWQGKLSAAAGGGAIVVRFPTGATKLPLVVFAHGFQLAVNGYDATLEHIAKFGYVVASVDYTQNLFDQDHHAPVDSMKDAITRLTTSPPPEVGAVVDPDRIASMGHSLGGKGAIWAALELPAIKAVVALDPVDDSPGGFGQPSPKRPSLSPEKMGSLEGPALYLGTQLGVDTGSFGQACAPKASSACSFAAATPAAIFSRHATLASFGHMQFLDNSSCGFTCSACTKGPAAAEEPGKLLARAAAVAFLKAKLDGAPGYADYLDSLLAQASTGGVVLDAAAQTAFCKP